MMWYRSAGIGLATATLVGCTAIPLDQIEKASQTGSSGTPQCGFLQNLVDLDPSYNPSASPPPPGGEPSPKPGTAGTGRKFYFLVPAGQQVSHHLSPPPGAAVPAMPAQNVNGY